MESKEKLEKAIEELKNLQIPAGASENLIAQTIGKIKEQERAGQAKTMKLRFLLKYAAAAAVILCAFWAGRTSNHSALNSEQIVLIENNLFKRMEPLVTTVVKNNITGQIQNLMVENNQSLLALVGEKYSRQLDEYAAALLALSNKNTNTLIGDLVNVISEAQKREREMIAEEIGKIELAREQRDEDLKNNFVKFASETENEITLTKKQLQTLIENKTNQENEPMKIEGEQNGKKNI
jgi:hypothetical protein